MELTVYRQSSKERPDGTIVYKGEDAKPFVDEKIFFVADGLGGAAAIRHQQVNPDIFDSDKLLDTLFKGVYEKYDDERFVKYVTDSFFELFAVKDCYTENINNIKKSGYFASRIVTAILLHEMIYDPSLQPVRLFERYNSEETQEEKEAFLRKLGDYLASKIRDDMRKIAKNANLFYESSYSGLALLGSTLCATIYRETPDGVEALYLTAGDSRPYVWTEQDGLCQIIEDQEGSDGGMTNYIKANDGEDFGIRCNYMSFKKPCILFNSSDGCFDSGYFLSQMGFEKLILDKAVSSKDTDEMAEGLYETFLTYGKHDDSSTIAMKLFGYESFTQFKESAWRRLEQLKQEYLVKMPDVLEHDYVAEFNENSADMPDQLLNLKTKFESEKAVMDFCDEQVKCGKCSSYNDRMSDIDKKVAEAKQKKLNTSERVAVVVARNYIRLSQPQDLQNRKWSEKRSISRILDIGDKYQQKSDDYISLIERYRSDFEETTGRLKTIIEQIYEIGIPTNSSDYDEISIGVVNECEKSMESLFEFFHAIKRNKQGAIKQLSHLRQEYIEQNLKMAGEANLDNANRIREQIISGEIDMSFVQERILKDDFAELQRAMDIIRGIDEQIVSLEGEEREKAFRECRRNYWEENYLSIISDVISDTSVSLPEDLKAEAKGIIDNMDSQVKELRDKAELQTQLFKQYDISYGRYLGGEDK